MWYTKESITLEVDLKKESKHNTMEKEGLLFRYTPVGSIVFP